MKTMISTSEAIKEFCNENDQIILEALGLSPDRFGDVQCSCPVHGGNNKRGFSYRTNLKIWKCWTNHCEEEFGSDLIGLIRSINKCSYNDAITFAIQTIGKDPNIEDVELKRFIRKNKLQKAAPEKIESTIFNNLDTSYFESRGLSKKICEQYKTFQWIESTNPLMHNRYCIPIYNELNEMVGYTGRALDNEERKWVHGPNDVQLRKVLFNLNFAKSTIEKLQSCVLVEGPLDSLKLMDSGIINVVSGLSIGISREQLLLLLKNKCKKLYILLDPDEAGQKASEKIIEKYSIYMDIINLTGKFTSDPSDFTANDIIELKKLII